MPEFPYSRLRRWPDVEAENLQAHDATDLLLVEWALALDVPGDEIAVIGDEYGAVTLALTDAGRRGIRVHQDLATGRRALVRNAEELGLGGFSSQELDAALLEGARVVLLQLPKSLAELEEIADAVVRWAAPDVVLVAGGRVKHMTLGQNEVLGRSFAQVQAQRAERKSRLVVAAEPLPAGLQRPFPVTAQHDGLTLVAHGGAFAGPRLDIGTRVLLEVLGLGGAQLLQNSGRDAGEGRDSGAGPRESDRPRGVVHGGGPALDVIDLGCGTGALAAAYALAHPEARVIATDRSAAAVASTRATAAANGLADRIVVTHDDAGSDLPDASADVVLLNPPFHLGTSVHTGAATRLFEAAARLLRPGGDLFTVFNSSLGYRAELTRIVGATEQLHRTSKFTVTRSIRR
ncbi:class I SAM-dependent methyltransferase [Microbacterium sp. W4I20]|uniref:class I SAM-dependent methyltransferase n=1 Tax=Microbacterium sp. W4I20 TaxID=3042262 RepID=UPI00278B7ABC|nr:methyltransferase [Microbacterium sp. W4I20]MDQ0727353.1 16S rRNA (guanine1207-N2)-methyltransferase [Microbacterium sp. W4I20]